MIDHPCYLHFTRNSFAGHHVGMEILIDRFKMKLLEAEWMINSGRIDVRRKNQLFANIFQRKLIFNVHMQEANGIAVLCMIIDSSSADAAYLGGLCSYYKGDLAKGLTYIQKAIDLEPDHDRAQILKSKADKLKEIHDIGDNLYEAGKFYEAYSVFTNGLEIDSSNANINSRLYFKRAECNNGMQEYRECVLNCEAAVEINRTCEYEQALEKAKIVLKEYERPKTFGNNFFRVFIILHFP